MYSGVSPAPQVLPLAVTVTCAPTGCGLAGLGVILKPEQTGPCTQPTSSSVPGPAEHPPTSSAANTANTAHTNRLTPTLPKAIDIGFALDVRCAQRAMFSSSAT